MLGKPGFPAAFLTTKSIKQTERLRAIKEYLDTPGDKPVADVRCALNAFNKLASRANLPKYLSSRYNAKP